MKTVVLAMTNGGKKIADLIASGVDECSHEQVVESIGTTLQKLWQMYDGFICVMASGIVVRSIAPLLKDKKNDPCVIVVDQKGEFVISLLSGHLGGGNELARKIAEVIGGKVVITTASDVTGHTAVDLWIRKNDLTVSDDRRLTAVSAKIVNKGFVTVYSDILVNTFPSDFREVSNIRGCDIVFSYKRYSSNSTLRLCPKNLIVGLGCNRNTDCKSVEDAVLELLEKENIDINSIAAFASIDVKSDEEGLLQFAQEMDRPILFYSKNELNSVQGVSTSLAALSATGAKGVAEPAAILGATNEAGSGKLIVRKHAWKDVTVAIAEKRIQLKDSFM